MPIPFHPYAEIFPMMAPADFAGLVEDVRANDIREKIVVWDGAILDGRNRYRAGLEAGLIDADDGPDRSKYFHRFIPDIDGDPLKFVLSKNLHRRHLTTGQRAYAMAEYETLRHGGARKPDAVQDANLRVEETRAELAERGHVSERSIASAATVRDHGVPELKSAVRQGEIAVSAAERIARMPEEEQPAAVAAVLPSGNRSIMASRQEPDDSLDYFPTAPWATRALFECVLPQIGVRKIESAWEPACGEGHMAEVLSEYANVVLASDIHAYGYGEPHDFLGRRIELINPQVDWIITNPPFGPAEDFAHKALSSAKAGVALFVRWQWIETVGRYERLFSRHPPTLVCPFVERVPVHRGRWEPKGDTATAYCWIVWHKQSPSWNTGLPTLLYWIPPGRRAALTKPDDAERFTAHPVIKRPRDSSGSPITFDRDTGEVAA